MNAVRSIVVGVLCLAAGGAFGVGVDAYVQDGLVAVWDGFENGGTSREHVSSPQQWKDCIGDRAFELTGVTAGNDHFYFTARRPSCPG